MRGNDIMFFLDLQRDVFMDTSHLSLVKEILIEKYGQQSLSPSPSIIQEEDFQVGLQLFTKLAVLSIKPEGSSKLSDKKIELESEEVKETTTKIKEFIEEYSFNFWQICETGFPFSILDPKVSETTLDRALKSGDSIVTHLIKHDDSVWFTEKELEEKFGEAFKHLNIEGIGEACLELERAYIREGDKKAGYYLLWLIKHISGCNFEIPSKETFDKSIVKVVLSKFIFSKFITLTYPIKYPNNFIELLHFKSSRFHSPIYQSLLMPECHSIFLNYTLSQLHSVSMAAWPNKRQLIIELLETTIDISKAVIAQVLKSSSDPQTAEVGQLILSVLISKSLRAAIPHFYRLQELLPNFDRACVEIIFGRPFVAFQQDRTFFRSDPEFTKRLQFNGMRKVFISGDLMIGVYNSPSTFDGKGVPPHLLAFNMKTEKMEWGIPLTSKLPEDLSLNPIQTFTTFGIPRLGQTEYHLDRVGEDITLQFIGEKNVCFIDPNSGETKATIVLPYEKKDEYDDLYLTPSGFGYQLNNFRDKIKLIGGKIEGSILNPIFEVEAPRGDFLPLSTHVGFFDDLESKLVLFGPTGKSVTISCLSAYASGDKIYLVEPNPSDENTCKLTIRSMTNEDHVVSDSEKSIVLKTKSASIKRLCDNGQLILYSGSFPISVIFVNLDIKEIVYEEKPLCNTETINTATGELWSWDRFYKTIWKISSKGITKMGSLKSGLRTTFLHVDQNNCLYFCSL